MKRIIILSTIFMAIAIIIGCKPSTQKPADDNQSADSTQVQAKQEEKDTTMYGTCTDGAMHTLIMKTEDGSIHTFQIDLEDSATVFGGIAPGDQMAVDFRVDGLNDTIATKVINLTTLQATWSSLDRNFEIQKGGTVQSHQQGETQPWTSWRILNGRLILNKDTFDIDRLDGDSLYLENQDGIYAFSRAKK